MINKQLIHSMIDLLQRPCTQSIVLIFLLIYSTYQQSILCYWGSNNCQSCISRWQCGNCYPGYSLVQGALSKYCTKCSDQRCLSCPINDNVCEQCAQSYYLDSGNCNPCSMWGWGSMWGCDICDPNYCYKCLPAYRHVNSIYCQRCDDGECEVCDAASNICTFCRPPYGVSGNTCAPCTSYCRSCQTDYNVCNQCYNGYGVNNTTRLCQPCTVSSCSLCNYNSTYCIRCVSGYGQINGQCQSCVHDRCLTCSTDNYNNCSSCIDGFGASNGICIDCPVNCQLCSFNVSECTSCDDGYTVLNGVCQPCNIQCQTCNGIDYCLTCTGAFYALGGDCINCSTFCLSCTTGSTCSVCGAGYFINSLNVCQICPDNCTECFYDFSYTTINCTVCISEFVLNMNPASCIQICGDSLAVSTPCDYQLGIKYDGCSDACQVEQAFICNKTNKTSICSYQNQTIMEIVSIIQSFESNSFTMRVSVWPPLYVFRTSDLKPVFRITNPIFTIVSVQFDYATSEFIFKVDFNSTCWNCQIVLEFVPDPTVDQRYFASVNSQANVFLELYYFSNLGLSMNSFVPYFCYAIVGIGMLAALLGLFAKRLAGLESIITCQMAFICLIWINTYLLRPFSQAFPLQYILGYHINITQTSNSTARLLLIKQKPYYQEFPYQIQFGFDQNNLANNVNVMLYLQGIAFIFSLITSIIFGYFNHKFQDLKKKEDEQGMQILRPKHTKILTAKEISFQCLMYFGMLNLVGFTSFTVLFFKNNTLYTNNILNLIILGLGLLFYSFTYLLFILDPVPFDYFRFCFKRSSFAMMYYFLYSLALISTILLLELLAQPWPPLIPIGCLFIFTLVYQPYRQIRDNIRASFNMLVILGFLSLRVLIEYSYQKPEEINDNGFILYLIDLIFMLICVIIGLVFLIYQIVTYFSKKNKEKNVKYEVMYELQKMNVKKNLAQNQIDDKQNNVFGQLLSEKTNILQFSNMISGMKDNKIKFFHQSDNQQTSIKNIRKEMEKERIQNNYNSTKTQDLKNAEEKIHMNQFRQKIETQEEGLLLNQKKGQNKKLLYAMQVIRQQNTWINFKHARDYTIQKIREGVKEQFINKYDQI